MPSSTSDRNPSATAREPRTPELPLAEFRDRRKRLRQSLGNAVLVLEGNTESERGDTRTGFFQETSFLYLTGWQQPGALLVLAPADAGTGGEILFLPDRDEAKVLWTGSGVSSSSPNIGKLTGFRSVARRCEFESSLSRLLSGYESIYCLGEGLEQTLRSAFPMRQVQPAQPLLAALRSVKSNAEVARIRDAVRVTMAGQLRGWRSLQNSAMEFEVAADITHEFLRLGAQRHAFAPIVAAGQNACVLHYARNRSPLRRGDLAILDTGAELDGYAGDLTRTIPVRGRFSKRQRLLYEAVLDVQREILRHVMPGTFLSRQIPGSLHQLAVDLFGQLRLGPGRKPLSDYFPHGIGHHLGLDVHDLCDPNAPLRPGAVVTVEPGIYIPEEGIGIRIEDDVLVTADGSENLSASLPKAAEEIEALLLR